MTRIRIAIMVAAFAAVLAFIAIAAAAPCQVLVNKIGSARQVPAGGPVLGTCSTVAQRRLYLFRRLPRCRASSDRTGRARSSHVDDATKRTAHFRTDLSTPRFGRERDNCVARVTSAEVLRRTIRRLEGSRAQWAPKLALTANPRDEQVSVESLTPRRYRPPFFQRATANVAEVRRLRDELPSAHDHVGLFGGARAHFAPGGPVSSHRFAR